MNFFKRLHMAFSPGAWDQAIRDFVTGDGPSPDGLLNIDRATALKFTAVFSCIRVLGETLASVPVFEYTKTSNDDREKTDETGLNEMFRVAPNADMEAFQFLEMGMAQINLGGNFVCNKTVARNGRIIELYPIDWPRVTIERDQSTQRLRFKVSGSTGTQQIYTRGQLFHIPGPSIDGIVGMSPIEYAAQAVRLGLTYETFSNSFFKNGALSTGLFKHPKTLNDEAYKRLKDDLAKNWQGLMNAGRPILGEDGLDFVPLNMKMVDAELLASKKFQIEDVCRIYRVPLHLVQNLDKATFSNIEQQALEFVMYTMLPWFKRWENCINRQLLTPEMRAAGRYVEFNISGLLRGDQKSMAEAFAVGRQWGWLSVNDIRRMMNLNSIGPAGDIYLQPMNMIEAGTETNPEEVKSTLEKKKLVDEALKIIEARKV